MKTAKLLLLLAICSDFSESSQGIETGTFQLSQFLFAACDIWGHHTNNKFVYYVDIGAMSRYQFKECELQKLIGES